MRSSSSLPAKGLRAENPRQRIRSAAESVPTCGLAQSYRLSNRSSTFGSAPGTSSIFTRLRDPATSVTGATADSERRSHRGQRSRGRLAVHGSLTDPDHQGPIMIPADARTGRPRPNPDSNTHGTSVRPARRAFRQRPVTATIAPPAHSRDEAYRQPGLAGSAQASGARAGPPLCTGSGSNRVRVRVDRLWRQAGRRLRKPQERSHQRCG